MVADGRVPVTIVWPIVLAPRRIDRSASPGDSLPSTSQKPATRCSAVRWMSGSQTSMRRASRVPSANRKANTQVSGPVWVQGMDRPSDALKRLGGGAVVGVSRGHVGRQRRVIAPPLDRTGVRGIVTTEHHHHRHQAVARQQWDADGAGQPGRARRPQPRVDR